MGTTCHILVRNVESNADQLDFTDFVLRRIRQGDEAARSKARYNLGTEEVYCGNWVITRQYQRPGHAIAEDAEEILFLLRLFRPGELKFVRLRINDASTMLTQCPYRVISPIVGNSSPHYRLDAEDVDEWLQFRKDIKEAQSWSSAWVRVCKKFFLYGTSVEFNVDADELDRVVNYMMAIEAALVPEKDFVSARLKQRALALVQWHSADDEDKAKKALAELYSVRSSIAHGSRVGDGSIRFLRDQRDYFESLVRRILREAILQLPAEDHSRKSILDDLFAVTDEKRADDVFQKFRAIKSGDVRDTLITKLRTL